MSQSVARSAVPQAQRFDVAVERGFAAMLREGGSGGVDQLPEGDQVERGRAGCEQVSVAPPRQVRAGFPGWEVGLEQSSQRADVLVDHVERADRGVLVPDQVDQLARAGRPPLAGQEQGEQIRLLPRAGVQLDVVAPQSQRTEDLEAQGADRTDWHSHVRHPQGSTGQIVRADHGHTQRVELSEVSTPLPHCGGHVLDSSTGGGVYPQGVIPCATVVSVVTVRRVLSVVECMFEVCPGRSCRKASRRCAPRTTRWPPATLDSLTLAELLAAGDELQTLTCQLPTQSHRILARLQAETTPKEMGAKSWRTCSGSGGGSPAAKRTAG